MTYPPQKNWGLVREWVESQTQEVVGVILLIRYSKKAGLRICCPHRRTGEGSWRPPRPCHAAEAGLAVQPVDDVKQKSWAW